MFYDTGMCSLVVDVDVDVDVLHCYLGHKDLSQSDLHAFADYHKIINNLSSNRRE